MTRVRSRSYFSSSIFTNVGVIACRGQDAETSGESRFSSVSPFNTGNAASAPVRGLRRVFDEERRKKEKDEKEVHGGKTLLNTMRSSPLSSYPSTLIFSLAFVCGRQATYHYPLLMPFLSCDRRRHRD